MIFCRGESGQTSPSTDLKEEKETVSGGRENFKSRKKSSSKGTEQGIKGSVLEEHRGGRCASGVLGKERKDLAEPRVFCPVPGMW